MIVWMNPAQSRITFTKSSVILPIPLSSSSSSFPCHREFVLIRAKLSTIPNNLVVDHSSCQKDLQLSWIANSSGFICQVRERIDWKIAGGSLARVPIRASSMPTPIGSASFYPIKGLFFFLQNEHRVVLWKRIAKFTAEVGVAAVAVCGSLFKSTFYSQQSLVLKVLPHFFGTPGTIILILIETAIPLTLFFYRRMHRVQEKLFVDVLRIQGVNVEKASENEREWIDEQREVQRREIQGHRPSIFRLLADPATLYDRPLTKYLVTLPLNFVPVAGQAAFCWVNSMDMSTPLHHYYYSKLKGLSSEEESAVIFCRRKQYQQFGLTATALSLCPGANIVLLLTNSVGAALWAADIEKALAKRHKL